MRQQNEVLKKILRAVKRYWPALIGSVCLAALSVVMTLYIPILVGNAIDCIVDAGRVDFAAMWVFLRRVAACAAVAGVSQWLMRHINNKITFQVTRDIRTVC